MQNKLSDLNNHLFAQLERLGDEGITGEKLTEEIGRAKAVTDVAQQIIANGSLVLKAETMMHEYGINMKNAGDKKMPSALRTLFLEG
jgi:hypothetical protein